MFFILTASERNEDAEKDWQRVGEADRERGRGQRWAPLASLSFLWSISHEHDNDHGIGDNDDNYQ